MMKNKYISPFIGAFNPESYKIIYFKIDVLKKYFENPMYLVFYNDYRGSICLKDEYDNDKDDYDNVRDFGLASLKTDKFKKAVGIFEKDFFDMPENIQRYWDLFYLDEQDKYIINCGFYKNLILGEWETYISIYSALLLELKYINEMCLKMGIDKLFMKDFSDCLTTDDRPLNYNVLLLPTKQCYYDFVSVLEKLTTGNINTKVFKTNYHGFRSIDTKDAEGKQKASLTLLVEWINANNSANIDELINKPLRKLIKERQIPAHEIYTNELDEALWKKQSELIHNVYNAIRTIRLIFANHPKAKTVEIPDYLFDGEHIIDY